MAAAKDDKITRIRSSKTNLFYACIECSARVNKESDSSKFFDFNTQLASSEKKNRAEILRLKRELEAAQDARQKDNAALHDLQNNQQRLMLEREQIVRTEVRESKKRRQSEMNTTMLDSSDMDESEGNYSAINKLTLNLHQTVDTIKKELATQFQMAITTMTEKFVEMIDRNNILLRNELLNTPSTSAAARQQQIPVTHDLLLDNFPQMPMQHTQFNFPPPLQPAVQSPIMRSQSRPRQQQQVPKIKATFAAVLSRSKEKPESIRNVRTTGTDEERAVTMAALQRENACMQIRSKPSSRKEISI